jgi:hypothetical protein
MEKDASGCGGIAMAHAVRWWVSGRFVNPSVGNITFLTDTALIQKSSIQAPAR